MEGGSQEGPETTGTSKLSPVCAQGAGEAVPGGEREQNREGLGLPLRVGGRGMRKRGLSGHCSELNCVPPQKIRRNPYPLHL